MKRILFLAVTDINKKDGGGLGQKGYYQSFETLFPDRVDLMMPEEYCVGKYEYAIGVPSRNKVKSIISGSIHRYKSFLRDYLKGNKDTYELCVISGGVYAGDMMDMIHGFGLKIMVIHVNYEPEYHMDNRTIYTLYGLTPYFVKKNERKAYLSADCNCFMSKEDEESFMIHYGKSLAPGVIVGAYEAEPKLTNMDIEAGKTKKVMSITGSMNTVQTIEGIINFKDYYYNSFKRKCPDWKIVIAGRNPASTIYDFANSNQGIVSVIPNPESMDNIIMSSSIFCCPTHVGGGIKLRIMDGLRNGRPVLAHKVSARGYEIMHNCPFFKIYHDKDSFEKGLEDLIGYVNHYNPCEVYDGYMKYFSFEAGTKRFEQAIKYIINDNTK